MWSWPRDGQAFALKAADLGLVLEVPFAAKNYIVFPDPNTEVYCTIFFQHSTNYFASHF